MATLFRHVAIEPAMQLQYDVAGYRHVLASLVNELHCVAITGDFLLGPVSWFCPVVYQRFDTRLRRNDAFEAV